MLYHWMYVTPLDENTAMNNKIYAMSVQCNCFSARLGVLNFMFMKWNIFVFKTRNIMKHSKCSLTPWLGNHTLH